MARSWGHAVRPLTEDELARNKRLELEKCSSGKCQELRTHATRYSYVTGRGGRTGWSERGVCKGHAEKFAATHGVEITEAARPAHALQQALAEVVKTAEGERQ